MYCDTCFVNLSEQDHQEWCPVGRVNSNPFDVKSGEDFVDMFRDVVYGNVDKNK